MGWCRNSSCGDSRRAQEIKLSELKASVNGQLHLECGGVGDESDKASGESE